MEPYTIIYKGIVDVIETPCIVAPPFKMKYIKHLYGLMTAIWDTGSKRSMIDWSIAEAMEAIVKTKGKVFNVSGASDGNYCNVDILIPGGEEVANMEVLVGSIGQWKILIGMDIISRGDFAVSNYGGNTTMSFRMPSEGRIDFSKIRTRE